MQPTFRHRALATLALAAVSVCAPIPALAAGGFGSMIVFGDSLSDDGNNAAAGLFDPGQVITGNGYVPSSTYAARTYSNGPVWASYAAAALGVSLAPSLLGGTDYAFGGATTGTPGPGAGGFPFSLLTQTAMYLSQTGNHAPGDALFVIAGGGNDARAALAAIGGGADLAATVASTAASFASNVGQMVDALQAAGAQHIVVWDTPNLGLAPAVVAGGAGQLGTFLAASMNGALAGRLAGEAGVSTFDIFGLGSLLSAQPGLYGFNNASDACGAVAGANCASYAYWDGIHPTTAAHRVIATAFVAAVVPEPSTWALTGVGLLALVASGRRSARRSMRG